MQTIDNFLDRRAFLSLAGAAAVAAALPARAQAYPTRPITILVPFAPGGPTDASARVVGRAMSVILGQPVIVENKPGAGGILGSTQAAQSAPDGYTLLWGGTSSLAVAPALYPNVKFSPERSFVPLGLATRGSMMLVGRSTFAPNTAREVVAYAKTQELKMGNGGSGSLAHLAAEYFREQAKIRTINIPYRGGGPALVDLLGGVLDCVFDNTAFLAQHVKSGKLKPYAVTGRERHKDFPDVPTVAEVLGVDFEVYSWFGLFAPSATPAPVLSTLSIAMAKANFDTEVRKALISAGLEPTGVQPSEAARIVSADYHQFEGIIKRAKITTN